MRIAYICADPGIPVYGRKGASVHVQEVIRAMGKLGHDVTLFAARIDGDAPADLTNVLIHKLPRATKGLDAAAREQAAMDANHALTDALESAGPFDLVYERYSLWSMAGMAFARAQDVPGILEVNAPLIQEQSRHRSLHHAAAAEQVAREVFGAASAIVAVSQGVADYVTSFPEAAGRVHVVPNGVDVARFAAAETPLLADAGGEFVVGFVGTLKAWHGMEVLIDAFAQLYQSVPHARLLIVGDGPLLIPLQEQLARRGCLHRATFTGAVDHQEVPGWLASMDVAVAPYPDLPDFYFSPLKVYEYMAAGLPVVASAIGQIPDVITHETNGLLVRPGAVDDLAAALLRLVHDTGLGVRLGQAASATVRAEHTWDAVAARILGLVATPVLPNTTVGSPAAKSVKRGASPESLQAALPGLWQIVRRFRAPLQRQWRLLLLGLAAMLGVVLMRVVEPWPLKFVVDFLSGDATAPAGAATGALTGALTVLGAAAVAMVLAVAGRALLAYISTIAMAQAGTRVTMEIRAELYQHLLALPMSFFQRNRSAALLTAVIGDIGRLQDVAVAALLPLAVNILTLVSMLGVMLWLNWQLTLLALCAFPLASLTMRRMSGKIRTAARKQRKREAALASAANEAFTAMPVVKIFGLQQELGHSFTAVTKKEAGEDVKGRRLAARLEREVDIYIAAGTALSVFFGALLVTRQAMTLGELIIFLSYLKTAFRPLTDMAKYTGRISKAVASGERVIALLDEPVEPDAPVALPAPPLTGAVAFDDVTFGYHATRPVLRNVSFSVEPGQFVALVGPSGAGKSSLAALMGRFYDPWSGRILVDGQDVRTFTRASLRAQLSMVFQESMLFGVGIGENIRYGRLDADDNAVTTAAQRANAHGFIRATEAGYATELGERGASLSGGQQRRIAIARAAVRHAPIVVLDEPTTGLDNANEHVVHAALAELTRDATTLLITHDLRWAQQADRILFLDDGRICEEGTHAELMALGGRYAAMATLQSPRNAAAQPAGLPVAHPVVDASAAVHAEPPAVPSMTNGAHHVPAV